MLIIYTLGIHSAYIDLWEQKELCMWWETHFNPWLYIMVRQLLTHGKSWLFSLIYNKMQY